MGPEQSVSRPTRRPLSLRLQYADVANGTAGSDEIFALAELSFRECRAYRGNAPTISPPRSMHSPSCFRMALTRGQILTTHACGPPAIYTIVGLTSAFESADRSHVELRGGEFALPFGKLEVAFDPASLIWAGRTLDDFIPIGDFEVHGLADTYRQAGIGAPLAASAVPRNSEQGFQVAPRMKVPVTAVLCIAGARRGLAAGDLDATLEIHPPSEAETINLGGQDVPLEIERTAALAYGLGEHACGRPNCVDS